MFLFWPLPLWLRKINYRETTPKLWIVINQLTHISKLSDEKFRFWNSWPWWAADCRRAVINFLVQMHLCLLGFALILCHLSYFSTVFCISSLLLSYPHFPFIPHCLLHCTCFPVGPLPSVFSCPLFSYLNVLVPFLHFCLDTLLTDQNMELKSMSKQIFKTFSIFCS